MNRIIGTGVIICVLFGCITFMVLNGFDQKGQYYDCSIAEFHPDYPLEVKQKCRELLKRKVTDI